MRKLEQYLQKISQISSESVSTYSKYYQIDNCKIRLSDHFHSQSDADVDIVIPINPTSKYAVISHENGRFYLWNTQEIIEFIPELVKFCNLQEKKYKTSQNFIIKKKISKFTGKTNSKQISSVLSHPRNQWSIEELCTLKKLLETDLDIRIPELPKEYTQYLRETGGSYSQVMNLYKALYIDNNLPVNTELIIQIINNL